MAAFRLNMEIQRTESEEEEEAKKKYKFGDGIRAIKKKLDQKNPTAHEPTTQIGKIKQKNYISRRGKNRNVTVAKIGDPQEDF